MRSFRYGENHVLGEGIEEGLQQSASYANLDRVQVGTYAPNANGFERAWDLIAGSGQTLHNAATGKDSSASAQILDAMGQGAKLAALFGGPTAVAFDVATNPIQQTSSQVTVKPVQSPTERDIINTTELWMQQLNEAAGIQSEEVQMGNMDGTVDGLTAITAVQQSAGSSYTADDTLRNHIENVDTTVSRKRGIDGAHNKEVFLKNDIQIVSSTPHPQIKGVEIICYQLPKRDKTGASIPEEYQSGAPLTKSVYDPNIISTDEYLRRGIEAANDAAKSYPDGILPRIWSGCDSQGIRWRGYYENGRITSFYPE